MGSTREDQLVKVAIKNGLINPAQLVEILRELSQLRREGEPDCTLAELLERKGVLRSERASAILQQEEYRSKAMGESRPLPDFSAPAAVADRPTPAAAVLAEEGDDPGSTQRREKLARFEDYRIIRRLGQDALGVTYQALYIPDHSRVILRILHKEKIRQNPQVAQEFLAGLKRAYKLDHSGIQKILRGARRDDRLFYAAEYLTGTSLRRVLQERGRLDMAQTLEIAVQAARALEYAHNKQIYHTQLDPSKFILDADGRVRLVGFGVGGDAAGNLQWLADALGDLPYYVAPEMVTAGGAQNLVGPGTDLYSLGAVMFHCLSGVPPFMGNSLDEVLLDMYQSETLYERLTTLPNLPAQLRTLLQRMLTPEPGKRLRSASELLRGLLQIQALETPERGRTAGGAKKAGKETMRAGGRVKKRRLLKKIREKDGEAVADRGGLKLLAVAAVVLAVMGYLVIGGLSSRSEAQGKMILDRQDRQQREHLEKLQKALGNAPPPVAPEAQTRQTASPAR